MASRQTNTPICYTVARPLGVQGSADHLRADHPTLLLVLVCTFHAVDTLMTMTIRTDSLLIGWAVK